ncbi:hypothetical protein ACTNNG_004541 [Vibrio parahaemolyticus]|nr:hypothetical protein [Vibrio parahaemolyticus]ELA8147244.1 hypothetical protein [Vibrio parahaemolyticus]ELA8182251.1 hypothetical protein [Vibrio parahaemolyticus]
MSELEKFLLESNLKNSKTIQSSTFLEPLEDAQQEKLEMAIQHLLSEKGSTIVFRGVSRSHLLPILSNSSEEVSEAKMVSLLFYFGEKAKHYYKVDDEEAFESRWVKSIEDKTAQSASVIFSKIRKVLKNKKIEVSRFKENNPQFASFFLSDNKKLFVQTIKSDAKLRDYYLYFLHTAGLIGIQDKTLLVSTSKKYSVTKDFISADESSYIICYVIPREFSKYAISHDCVQSDDYVRKVSTELPLYGGHALYDEQFEVSVKGALFAHHIFGVLHLSEEGNVFYANPHLFSEVNSPEAISDGLWFDQSDFESRLKSSKYHRGVGLYIGDDEFYNINPVT